MGRRLRQNRPTDSELDLTATSDTGLLIFVSLSVS